MRKLLRSPHYVLPVYRNPLEWSWAHFKILLDLKTWFRRILRCTGVYYFSNMFFTLDAGKMGNTIAHLKVQKPAEMLIWTYRAINFCQQLEIYIVTHFYNPFLFIRGFSYPCGVQTSLTQNFFKDNYTWISLQPPSCFLCLKKLHSVITVFRAFALCKLFCWVTCPNVAAHCR